MTTDASHLEEPADIDVLDQQEAAQAVIRGSALRTAGYVVATFANALALPFLFRYLGVSDSGRYVTAMSILTVLGGVVEVGLAQVTVREYTVATHGRRPALMAEIVSMRLAMLTASFVLTLAFMVVVGYPGQLIAFVAVGSAGIFFENLGSSYNVHLTTTLRFGWLTVSNVARQIVAALLTVTLVIARAPLIAFFALLIPAALTQLAISTAATWRRIPHGPSWSRAVWPLFRRSVSYVTAMTIGFVYFRIPVVLVSLMASARSTGYFGAAFRLVETLTLMTGFVLSAAVPLLTRAASNDEARHRYGLMRLLEVSLIIGAGLTAVTAVSARLIIAVVAGSSFNPSVGLLQVLSLVLFLRFVNTAWGFALLSVGRYRVMLAANLCAVAAATVVGLVAIPAYGGSGGVASALAAELVLTAAYAVGVRRVLPEATFPWRTATVSVTCMLLACGTLLIGLSETLEAALGTLLFVLLISVARVLPPEIVAMLRTRWSALRRRLPRSS